MQDESSAMNLHELLAATTEAAKKAGIMESLKTHLLGVSSKPSLRHSLHHRLLAEYVREADDAGLEEMADALKERLVEIIHTRDGAHAAIRLLWQCSAKDRKLILRSLKGLVPDTAKEEAGHLFLIALLDTVDDTVTLGKLVLKELTQRLDFLVGDQANQWARRVIHHVLHPRNPRVFPKETQAFLALGHGNPHSKKEPANRHRELLSHIAGPLLFYCAGNMDSLVWQPGTSLLVAKALEATASPDLVSPDVAESVAEGRRRCFEALAEMAGREFVPCDMENRLHLVEHKNGNFLLGVLLRCERWLVSEAGKSGADTLAGTLATQLSSERLASFASCNKGAFVLLHLFETGEASAVEAVRGAVKSAEKRLQSYSFPAASLLLRYVLKGEKSAQAPPAPPNCNLWYKTAKPHLPA